MQNKIILTDEQKQAIMAYYAAGKTLTETATKFGLKRNWVWEFLKRVGANVRTPSEALNQFPVNEGVFATVTDISAYWIGMIITDGSVQQRGENSWSIGLELAAPDEEHIKAFRDFICPTGIIYHRERTNSFSIRAHSQKVAMDLAAFGIVPNKSLTAKASESIASNRHFWRGCIDGDGWVWFKGGYYKTGLCGSKELVGQFADYCGTIIKGFRPSITPCRNIWRVNIAGRKAITILKHLYLDCSVAMPRKLKTAMEAIAAEPQDDPGRTLIYSGQQTLLPPPKDPTKKRKPIFVSAVLPLEYQGETLPLNEMASKHGLTTICLQKRLGAGMSIEQAIKTPKAGRGGDASKVQVILGDETNTLKYFAEKHGQKIGTVYARYSKLGWTLEQALGLAPKPARKAWNATPLVSTPDTECLELVHA